MLVRGVLRASRVGVRHPNGGHAQDVCEDVVGNRAAQAWQNRGPRAGRRLERLDRAADPGIVQGRAGGGHGAPGRRDVDHAITVLVQMRLDDVQEALVVQIAIIGIWTNTRN